MGVQDWLSKLRGLNLGSIGEFLPQAGLDTVNWLEFLRQAQTILKTSSNTKLQNTYKAQLEDLLPTVWSRENNPDFAGAADWSKLDQSARIFWGEKVLELYFKSVLVWKKSNLDLRAEHFFFSPQIERPIGYFSFSRFYFEFDESFSKNMSLLYSGYYDQRPLDFRAGLVAMGLLGAEQDPAEIEGLFHNYFGQATDKSISFSLEKFRKSFMELFKYLKKHHRKIPANFVWLGLMLASMYETLEALGVEYKVREVYRRSIK